MGDNRERFERELHRLRGYRFKRLLVVGSEGDILAGQYHSNIKPQAVLATLYAFEVRYDVPVVFAGDATGRRLLDRTLGVLFAREAVVTLNDLWRAEQKPKSSFCALVARLFPRSEDQTRLDRPAKGGLENGVLV